MMDNFFLKSVFPKLNLNLRKQVPQILQTEAFECGLACIAMVCAYHNLHLDMLELRNRFCISTQGSSLSSLMQIADELKMKTRPVALEVDELKELKKPAIIHWDMNHFVVLVKVKKNKFIIHDPAFGRRTIGIKEISQHFTGVALELWPNVEFTPKRQQKRLKLRSFFSKVVGLKSTLVKIFCLSVVIEVINLFIPMGTQIVMDHVIVASDRSLLSLICLGLLIFILFRTCASALSGWISQIMKALINIQWQTGVFDHLMKLPLAYFEKRKLGDIQSRFGSLEIIQNTFTENIVSGIINTILSIGLLIMLFLYGS